MERNDRMQWDTMDSDDATVTSGSKMDENGPAEVEFLIRFQLPIQQNALAAKHLQAGMLFTILKAFPNDIIYIDNKNEEYVHTEAISDDTTLNKLKSSSMTAHDISSKSKEQAGNRWIIITKFRTTVPFRDWKKHDEVTTELRKHRIYMTPHQFEQKEWDIVSLGFLLGIHIVQFPLEAAKEHVENLIQQSDASSPPFSLAPSKVQVKGKPVYTRAYEVVCHRSNGSKLYHLLTHGKFRDPQNRIFIPYSLKRSNQSTFLSMIKENNQMLSDSYVMKFHGIPATGIQEIKRQILDISGVRHVVPTSKTKSHGEWRILIKSSKFPSVNGQIRRQWDDWCKMIPTQSQANLPDSFPAPTITSKNVKYISDQDDNSAESYGTLLSTASTLTMETMDDNNNFDTCPLDTNLPSYAQVLTGNQHAPSPESTITQSVHQQPVPTSTDYNTEYGQVGYNLKWEEENHQLQQRLREQETKLQELGQAKLELDQRLEKIFEEVHNKECRTTELENTIANLLNVVSDRDRQMEERDQQFELRNRQFDALMARLTIEYPKNPSEMMVPEQTNKIVPSLPDTPARSNKRQNTLPTPDRGGDTRMDLSIIDDNMNALTDSLSPILR